MARLLIVEDDPLVQRTWMRAFRSHTCVVANNGLEALKCLNQQHTFDLIISDVDMPLMNGIDFYRQLEQRFPEMKLVFLTASNVAGLEALGTPILSKDWPLAKILETVTLHLGVAPWVDAGETISKMGRW